MNNTINNITSQLGTLDEISLRVEAAKNELHIAKVSLWADVMAEELNQLKDYKFFPILELTPFFSDDNDLVSIDTSIYFKWAEITTQDKTVQSFKSSIISKIFNAYHKMELDDSILDVMNDLDIGHTLKSNSSFSITLNYNKDDIKEAIHKTLLTSEQLIKLRAIALEDSLTSKSSLVTKLTKV